MADFNQRKNEKNDNNYVGSGVGVVPGDTIASALDPFGGAAGAVGESVDSKKKRETGAETHDPKE